MHGEHASETRCSRQTEDINTCARRGKCWQEQPVSSHQHGVPAGMEDNTAHSSTGLRHRSEPRDIRLACISATMASPWVIKGGRGHGPRGPTIFVEREERHKNWLLHLEAARRVRCQSHWQPSPATEELCRKVRRQSVHIPSFISINKESDKLDVGFYARSPLTAWTRVKIDVCSVCILRGVEGISSAPQAIQPRVCVPLVSVSPTPLSGCQAQGVNVSKIK
jgi:hypothetical protein